MNKSQEYSVKRISDTLVSELKKALKSVKNYGSVEVFVQDGSVTQITVRNIRKTGQSRSPIGRA